MAKTSKDPKEIKPTAIYEVRLNRSVKHGPTWLRPSDRVRVSGLTLQELGDAVESYVEIK